MTAAAATCCPVFCYQVNKKARKLHMPSVWAAAVSFWSSAGKKSDAASNVVTGRHQKNVWQCSGSFLSNLTTAKTQRVGVTHVSLQGVNCIINEAEKPPPGEKREEGGKKPCMQEAERCSNYPRHPAFQDAESSSVHIGLLKFLGLFVSRQPGCEAVLFDFSSETRHKSEGLYHNGRNVTTGSNISYIIYGNLNNSAQYRTHTYRSRMEEYLKSLVPSGGLFICGPDHMSWVSSANTCTCALGVGVFCHCSSDAVDHLNNSWSRSMIKSLLCDTHRAWRRSCRVSLRSSRIAFKFSPSGSDDVKKGRKWTK